MKRSKPFRVVALALACALSTTAHAIADIAKTVDVVAGNLADALETLAKQCEVDVIYPSSQLHGLRTEGVSGVLETRAAFQELLRGTGLVIREEGGSVLITLPAGEPVKTTAWFAEAGAMHLAQANEGPSSAEENHVHVEEVVVTAERREADLQKTASSVSVQKGSELAAEGRSTLNQYLETVVGVSGLTAMGVGGTDSPETGIAIRGIKSNAGSATTNSLAVPSTTSLYVDGVYSGIGGTYDIDRVEVLRGPQGTLYGRSATGGVIAVHTFNPRLDRLSGNVAAESGSHGLRHYTGALNVPLLTDKLALRVSGNYFAHDSYDAGQAELLKSNEGRIKLLYKPLDDLSILLGYALQSNSTQTGGVFYRLTGPGTYYADRSVGVAPGRSDSKQYWAEVNWDIGIVNLTYQPTFKRYTQNSTVFAIGPSTNLLTQRVVLPTDNTMTHEVRVTSKNDTALTWQVGALYYKNHVKGFLNETRWLVSNALLNTRFQDRDVDDAGTFAEATYHFTPTTRLTAGLRYDRSTVRGTLTYTSNDNRLLNSNNLAIIGTPEKNVVHVVDGDAGAADFSNTTYKARLEHDLSEQNLLYASVSTGFIPGDVQLASSIPPQISKYEAQTLTAYEVGSKNRFFDSRLQLNGAIYFYDYGGYQTTVRPNNADPTVQLFVVTPAQMKGGELEAVYQLTPTDRLAASYAYIDPVWVRRPPGFSVAVVEKTITDIPPITANVSYDHKFTFGTGSKLNLRIEGLYRSGYLTNSVSSAIYAQGGEPFYYNPHIWTGNASATWTASNGKFTLTAYNRNFSDVRYRVVNSLQVVAPVTGTVTLSDPRTWGLIARFDF